MPGMAIVSRGPEFDAAMKALAERGKPQGRMRTWYCPECTAKTGKHTCHVDKGRPGCAWCAAHEARVGVDW